MSNKTTLKEIRDRALDYADMTDSGFAVTARVNDYINAGLSELHDILVNSDNEFYHKSANITLVSGTELYDLPDDATKINKVWYVNSDRRFKLENYHLDEVSGYRNSPIVAGTLELWYVPEFAKLKLDDQEVSTALHPGWEDFVALFAASRLLMREESDASAIVQEREIQRARIINAATPRDIGTAHQIGDYHGRWASAEQIFNHDERYLRYRLLGQQLSIIQFEYLGI